MSPVFSSEEWETRGTDEPDVRDTDTVSPSGSYEPDQTGLRLSTPLDDGKVDPQPFNPNYQLQTGITDWINLRSLGATGDGNVDDTGFFQAANIIAQQPPGRLIYIPAGTYKLTQNIVFTAGVSWLNMGTVTGGTLSGGSPLQFGGSTGMANPMNTTGDLITGGPGGSPTKLAVGSNGQILKVQSGAPAWVTDVTLTNPMTTSQDVIVGGTSGTPTRLAVGGNGQVLGVTAGAVGWVSNPAGFSNPMTTAQDLIVGGTAGAAGRLAVGTNGQALQVLNGAVAWAAAMGTPLTGPNSTQPTVFQQPDGSLVVVPLSFYSLSGDDSTWINTAFGLLPQVNSTLYSGSYNGPFSMGTVKLLNGDYTITSGIMMPVNSGVSINLIGHGPGTRLLVGNGATGIKSHCAMGGAQGGAPARITAGRIEGFHIDGTNAGNNSTGLELGGSWGRIVNQVKIANFTGTGSIALHLNNAQNGVAGEWTEKSRITCDLMENANACVIENSSTTQASAADSFEYNDISLYIIANNTAVGGKGVTLQGGAFMNGGSLKIRGNFPVNSGPVLTIQGNDGAGGNSGIHKENIDICVETTNSASVQSVNFGGPNNTMTDCFGQLSFQFFTWVATNGVSGNLRFGGTISESGTVTPNLASINTAPVGWV